MRRKHVILGLALLCLWAFFAQTAWTARRTSLTIDEGLHITSGYAILRTGDYRLVEEHPPLTKLWVALPLLPLRDLADPRAQPAWADAEEPTSESLPLLRLTKALIYPYEPLDRLVLPARLQASLLGVLLLAALFRFGRELLGPGAALVSVAFAACDPNLVAHGAVAATDVGTAAFITLSLLAAYRYLRRPSRARAALLGGALGLALTSKLSALMLGPALAVAWLIRGWRLAPRDRGAFIRQTALTLALMVGVFWAVYGFQVGPLPGTSFPVPAPAHAIPVLRLQRHAQDGHSAFLLGVNRTRGWWFYFPVAFALKTPLPALLLMLIGGALALRRQQRLPAAPALLFAQIYLVVSMRSPLNLGYRHLLPLLPLGYLLAGQVARVYPNARERPNSAVLRRIGGGVLAGLLLWQAWGTVRLLPYTLAYFNEAAGGPDDGWRYLSDSNTDWGQGYKALATFQAEEELPTVRLSAFIFYDPAIYGVDYEPLPPYGGDTPAIFPQRFAPPPGHYVISATPLDGIPLVDPEMYDWFRWRSPDARVAEVLFYYHVTPEQTGGAWLAQCSVPAPPLDADAIAAGFGTDELRRITFDCTQSWVVPQGTPQSPPQGAGYYALHGSHVADTWATQLHYAPPRTGEAFVDARLDATEPVYRQRRYGYQPAFALYRTPPGRDPAMPGLPPSLPAPAATAPASLSEAALLAAPRTLDGTLTLLGVRVASTDAPTVEVETWWRVEAGPHARPLSLMAHLLTPDGETLGVADGLGIPPDQWQPGDVIVQRHTFEAPEGPAGRWLRTGAYWRDDQRRLPVDGAPGADALFIPLDALPE